MYVDDGYIFVIYGYLYIYKAVMCIVLGLCYNCWFVGSFLFVSGGFVCWPGPGTNEKRSVHCDFPAESHAPWYVLISNSLVSSHKV